MVTNLHQKTLTHGEIATVTYADFVGRAEPAGLTRNLQASRQSCHQVLPLGAQKHLSIFSGRDPGPGPGIATQA